MFYKSLPTNLPKHIGIILDGNGRWAQKRGLPRNLGHKAGITAIDNVLKSLIKFNVKVVSFFAFSTENWKRNKDEIDGIFELVRDYIKNSLEKFKNRGVKVVAMGDLTKFPQDLTAELKKTMEETKNNDKIVMNLALNYGGRDDIAQAVNNLLKTDKKEITIEDISKNLYSADLPDPDFVIRTSGEQRLSNFMLFQMAYSELYFPKVLWPDFNEKHLRKALNEFAKRDRRYGGIKK